MTRVITGLAQAVYLLILLLIKLMCLLLRMISVDSRHVCFGRLQLFFQVSVALAPTYLKVMTW
jgi:hypothetical protein